MSEWNIKTRLSSAFLIAGGGDLTKRQRLHLLTASQRECKEITKSRLFTLDPALSCDFHFTVPVIAAVWQMLFVSFILSQKQGGSTLYSPCPRRLDLAQNTHLCFLGLHECIWPSLLVQNNRLLLGELLLCPLNLCEAGMKGVALVFISHVNYWYLPLRWLLLGWRWETSLHIMGASHRHAVWAAAAKKEDRSKTVNSKPPSLIHHRLDWLLLYLPFSASSSIRLRLKCLTLVQTAGLLLFL